MPPFDSILERSTLPLLSAVKTPEDIHAFNFSLSTFSRKFNHNYPQCNHKYLYILPVYVPPCDGILERSTLPLLSAVNSPEDVYTFLRSSSRVLTVTRCRGFRPLTTTRTTSSTRAWDGNRTILAIILTNE